MKNIIGKYRLLKIHNNDYHISDFIFELTELKEIFLAKKVLQRYGIFSPNAEAILSCSRTFMRNCVYLK